MTSNVSTASDDAFCCVCTELVSRTHKALECDICAGWIHLQCSGTSLKCYSTIQECEGLSWICCSCKESLRSSLASIRALEADNAALRLQVCEIQEKLTSLLILTPPTSQLLAPVVSPITSEEPDDTCTHSHTNAESVIPSLSLHHLCPPRQPSLLSLAVAPVPG